jgi:hypothetical protein
MFIHDDADCRSSRGDKIVHSPSRHTLKPLALSSKLHAGPVLLTGREPMERMSVVHCLPRDLLFGVAIDRSKVFAQNS